MIRTDLIGVAGEVGLDESLGNALTPHGPNLKLSDVIGHADIGGLMPWSQLKVPFARSLLAGRLTRCGSPGGGAMRSGVSFHSV